MAVFKVEKRNNFTVMNNYHLRDKNISHKARGLLSFMLSLPEDWDYSLSGLVSISKENKTAIRTALEELKEIKIVVESNWRRLAQQYGLSRSEIEGMAPAFDMSFKE